MDKNFLIVGISGATNSGKTTAVQKLCQYFPGCTTMSQDSYFLEPEDERLEIVPEVNHANWEKLSAMDMDLMMKNVNMWIEGQQAKGDDTTNLLLIEGILIFNHRSLAELFDKKYFLTLDKSTCEERRSGRSYVPPDPLGYFEKVIWPMYLQNKEDLKEQTDIRYLDGAEDQETIVNIITQDILNSL